MLFLNKTFHFQLFEQLSMCKLICNKEHFYVEDYN